MSLLSEIISEATGKTRDIPRLLRLCLTLAYKLKHDPLLCWVRHELEGYPKSVPLPAYRLSQGRSRGEFIGRMTGVLDLPASILPEKIRPRYETLELRDSISEYANLVEHSKEDSRLQIPWPPEYALKFGSSYVTDGQCVRAWLEISPSQLAAMIDQIITKVLTFALEIEAEVPNAEEIGSPNQPAIKEEQVTQIFKTTIQGNVQNYSAGSSHFQQIAAGSVLKGDLESLVAFLKTTGLADRDIEHLQDALKEDSDEAPAHNDFGPSVAGWLGSMVLKARKGLIGIGTEVVTGVVTQAILNFLGTAT